MTPYWIDKCNKAPLFPQQQNGPCNPHTDQKMGFGALLQLDLRTPLTPPYMQETFKEIRTSSPLGAGISPVRILIKS